jgi:hypothetical protein
MARSTQYIGLTNEALAVVRDFSKEEIEIATGIMDEPIMGYRYTSPNGKIFTEVVQNEVWSGGPMYFTCLKDENEEYFHCWNPASWEDC